MARPTRVNKNKKWEKSIQVNGKTCNNITEVDNALKGTKMALRYNRYRALINALTGGNTKPNVEASGEIILDDAMKLRVKNIEKLYFAKDFVIYKNIGETPKKLNLVGLRKDLSYYIYNNMQVIKDKIKYLETIDVNLYKSETGRTLSQDIAEYARLYSDMYISRETIAQGEKKTMIDILSILPFENLREVYLLSDSFRVSLENNRFSVRLAYDLVYGVANNPSEFYGQSPQTISELEFMALSQLNSDMNLKYGNAFLTEEENGIAVYLQDKNVKKPVNLEQVVLLTQNSNNATIEVILREPKDNSDTLGYLTSSGFGIKGRVSTGKSRLNRKEQVEDKIEDKNKDEISENDEKCEKVKNQTIQVLENIVTLCTDYNDLFEKFNILNGVANPMEQKIWGKNFKLEYMTSILETEYEYLKRIHPDEKVYKHKISFTILREYSILFGSSGTLIFERFRKYIPSCCTDDRKTINSSELGFNTLEQSKLTFAYFVMTYEALHHIIDIYNSLIIKTLADFLYRFGYQGLSIATNMTPMLLNNDIMCYTPFILESANRIYRDNHGAKRDMSEEEQRKAAGVMYNGIKDCLTAVNPKVELLVQGENRENVYLNRKKILNQSRMIFQQYNTYLNAGV